MSGNGSSKLDFRVMRTRDRLGEAIIALIQEKPFDAITVQEVLDRAGVGRSTFYEHYKDKGDVLISVVDEFFSDVATQVADSGEDSERLLPAREFFNHLANAQTLLAAFATSGRSRDVWDLAQAHFARGIEQRLHALPRAAELPPIERAARASAMAGSFVALVHWWLGGGMPLSPDAMDTLFHRVAWSGVSAAGGA